MFGYYIDLAQRSLRSNAILTALTVIAVAVGIGTSMTVFTVFRGLAADPIPEKSSQLFTVLIDNWGPSATIAENLRIAVSYPDAMGLLRAKHAKAQTALYAVSFTVTPPDAAAAPLAAAGHATYADFFNMFNVPFRSGRPWTSAEDEGQANVVVLGANLADRLFPGRNAVGQEVILNQQSWRVIGVMQPWDPRPHFYDLMFSGDEVLVPFQSAVAHGFPVQLTACNKPPPSGPNVAGQMISECQWVLVWFELPTPADVASFRRFLQSYTEEQRRVGRFNWPPNYHLYSLPEWLVRMKVVPDEMRLATLVAFGFLVVCLLNAIGLLLAKFTGRVSSLSVHRALGASRFDVFAQCLTESAVVGAAGGIVGLALMLFGLELERRMLSQQMVGLARLDNGMVAITLTVAVVATIACGAYPSWRASRVQPAPQLKAQ